MSQFSQQCCCKGAPDFVCTFHQGLFPEAAKRFVSAGFFVPYPAAFWAADIYVRRLDPDHFSWSRDHLRHENEYGLWHETPVTGTGRRRRYEPDPGGGPYDYYPHPHATAPEADPVTGELPLHYPNPYPLVGRTLIEGVSDPNGAIELSPSTGRDLFDVGYDVPRWHGRVPYDSAPGWRWDHAWMRHAGGAYLDNYSRILRPTDPDAPGVVECDDPLSSEPPTIDVWAGDVPGEYKEAGGSPYVDDGHYVTETTAPGCRNAKYDGVSGRWCEDVDGTPNYRLGQVWYRHDVPDLPPIEETDSGGTPTGIWLPYDQGEYDFWNEFRLSHGLGRRWRNAYVCTYTHAETTDHGVSFMQDKPSAWPERIPGASPGVVDPTAGEEELARKASMTMRDECDWATTSPETTEIDLFLGSFPHKGYTSEYNESSDSFPMVPVPEDFYDLEYDAVLRVRHTYLDLNVSGAIRQGSGGNATHTEVVNPKDPQATEGYTAVRVYMEGHTRRWVTVTDYYGFRFARPAFQSRVSSRVRNFGGPGPGEILDPFVLESPDTGPTISTHEPPVDTSGQAAYDLHGLAQHELKHRASFWPRDRENGANILHDADAIRSAINGMELQPEFLYGTVSVRNQYEVRWADFRYPTFPSFFPEDYTSETDPYWEAGDQWEMYGSGDVVDLSRAEFIQDVLDGEETYAYQTLSNVWLNGPYRELASPWNDGMGHGDGGFSRVANWAYPADMGTDSPLMRSYDLNTIVPTGDETHIVRPQSGYWNPPTNWSVGSPPPDPPSFVAGSKILVTAISPY